MVSPFRRRSQVSRTDNLLHRTLGRQIRRRPFLVPVQVIDPTSNYFNYGPLDVSIYGISYSPPPPPSPFDSPSTDANPQLGIEPTPSSELINDLPFSTDAPQNSDNENYAISPLLISAFLSDPNAQDPASFIFSHDPFDQTPVINDINLGVNEPDTDILDIFPLEGANFLTQTNIEELQEFLDFLNSPHPPAEELIDSIVENLYTSLLPSEAEENLN